MEYKRFGQTIIARMDKGEEILEQLKEIAVKEKIKLAHLHALGAVNDFTIRVLDTKENVRKQLHFNGTFEIVSLNGTINTMNEEYYSHVHFSAGNETGEVFGGHLISAYISATCEMIITVVEGRVDRYHEEETGLNLFKF